jgi:hypothetical protein
VTISGSWKNAVFLFVCLTDIAKLPSNSCLQTMLVFFYVLYNVVKRKSWLCPARRMLSPLS